MRLVSDATAVDARVRPTPETASPEPAPRRYGRGPLLTQRYLQVVLGLFWLLDAALQFQPYMFTKSFVTAFLAMNAMYRTSPTPSVS